MNDVVQLYVIMSGGFAAAAIVGQAVCCYRRHRGGDVSLEDSSTMLDGCVLIAICLIFADISPYSVLAAALAAYVTVLNEILRQVDKAALWLAQRHHTELVPQQKTVVSTVRDRYRK